MQASDLDPVLLDLEADYAAKVFAGWGEVEPDQYDEQLARRQATFVDALSLDGGDRLVSVWRIDEQLVLVSSVVVGEGEPLRQGMVLAA